MNRLSEEDSLQLARLLAKKIALDLDANDTFSLNAVGTLFLTLPIEAVLTACRMEIGVKRIVVHNLDKNKVWNKILGSFSKIFYRQ